MTDLEYEKLTQRVINGKAWVEKIKAEGTYGDEANASNLRLWFKLGDLLLAEDKRRSAKPEGEENKGLIYFQGGWHSQAWVDMKGREAIENGKREKARIRRAELAEERRKGLR